MTRAHLAFCQPGTVFFDRGARSEALPAFAALNREIPPGWDRRREHEWTHLVPRAATLPQQGWKIHVSATLENCERVLDTVMAYCIDRAVPFKVITSADDLRRRNAKDGDRTASGKFITIYPADDWALKSILEELGDELAGEDGPYILSDLRWRTGPLYVRYGAFVTHLAEGPDGKVLHCIRDPDGQLVEDRRGPSFRPPPWAPIPQFLEAAIHERRQGRLRDFPYRVHTAVQFSNGGGVYRASHTRTGDTVLLKEARPLAGLDDAGRDAIARQQTELWALRRLEGLPSSARLLDHVRGHEHEFLVSEFVEGESLLALIPRRNPLLRGSRHAGDRDAYARWGLEVLESIDRALSDMHARGVVFGDLHPGNILVRNDMSVTLIDLETASPLDAQAAQVIAAPGFRAPAAYRGVRADRFALGCLRLALFAPESTGTFLWDATKVGDTLRIVRHEFALPDDYEKAVRADIGELGHAIPAAGDRPRVRKIETASWPEIRRKVSRWICASATPGRDDRLYPGDIAQFYGVGAGLGLMHGAAGVLVTLRDIGEEAPGEHLDWLIRKIDARPSLSSGLYDGCAGIAYALERLGETERAEELAHKLAGRELDEMNGGMAAGLAGVGMTLKWFAARTRDGEFFSHACNVADRLLDHDKPVNPRRPGLVTGASGEALFLLSLYDESRDVELLDSAESRIRADLAAFGYASSGNPLSRGTDDLSGGRIMRRGVISGDGGVGLALAASRAWGRYDDELESIMAEISAESANAFVPMPGLLRGRSGALLVAAGSGGDEPNLTWHLDGLRLSMLGNSDGIRVFGDALLRLSCDLGTGAAGVLAVLDRVFARAAKPTELPLHLFGTA